MVTVLAVAIAFWASTGHQPPPCLAIHPEDLPQQTLGVGEIGGCNVWINRRLLPARTRQQANTLCWTVMHELGHTIGLSHEPSGIMAAVYTGRGVPGACWNVTLPATCIVCYFGAPARIVASRPPARGLVLHGVLPTSRSLVLARTPPPLSL